MKIPQLTKHQATGMLVVGWLSTMALVQYVLSDWPIDWRFLILVMISNLSAGWVLLTYARQNRP